MAKVKLSLKPLAEAAWETHEASGAMFLIAPLLPEDDQAFTRECKRPDGEVDPIAFAHRVAQKCMRDWKHVGEKGIELPRNDETVKTLVDHHAFTIMPWLIWRARGLGHYVIGEIEAAKKG